MNKLKEYTEKAQTKLLQENGAFFAFSKDSFNKQKQEGVKYISTDMGLLVPHDNLDTVLIGLKKIKTLGMELDIQENGLDGVIKRELSNYECVLTYDYSRAYKTLKKYPGITEELVSAIFQQEIQKHY